MASLATVQDYVTEARILLQDQVQPYRYADSDLTSALSQAFLEARRLRPDLFLGVTTLPSFSAVDTTTVSLDDQYKVAFLYYVCGRAQLRDEENTQDARATVFLNKFVSELTGIA